MQKVNITMYSNCNINNSISPECLLSRMQTVYYFVLIAKNSKIWSVSIGACNPDNKEVRKIDKGEIESR